MTSRVNRIYIRETSRALKRTPADFSDDAAQRSKRITSAAFERGLSSVYESRSPALGLKHVTSQEDSTVQRETPWPDPRLASGQPLPSPQAPTNLISREVQRVSFPSSYRHKYLSPQALKLNERPLWGSPPSSPANTYNDQEGGILLQLETRPITQEQLVNEVKVLSLQALSFPKALAPNIVKPNFSGWLTYFNQEFMPVW